ncbi:hypothetical protein ABZ915_36585 [Streptomyces sp. NPDC046915]|uniref:hypothetical protein n=1 Tax=Streptomyces sp. NPDC046915 TaxID=3155257 RepID=UPI0033BFFA5D
MRNRIAILAVAAALPLTGVTALATAGPAAADPNSSVVTVSGSVDDCAGGASPVKVSMTAGSETRVDNRTDLANTNSYSVTFTNIPKNTMGTTAIAIVSCANGSSYTAKSFTIMRPNGTVTSMDRVLKAPG